MSRTNLIGCFIFATSVALGIAYLPLKFPPATKTTPTTVSTEFPRAVDPQVGNRIGLLAASETSGQASSPPAAAALPSAAKGISAVWANEGGDKVTREELRTVTKHRPVQNSIWDG